MPGETAEPELSEQLFAIRRAEERSRWLAASSGRTSGLVCAAMGATQGAAVLLVGLETVRAIGLAVAVTLLVIALGVAGFSWVLRRATRLGWRRTVGRAETVACLLLLGGEMLRDSHLVGPLPAVWVPWALVAGGPLLVLGARELIGLRPRSPG